MTYYTVLQHLIYSNKKQYTLYTWNIMYTIPVWVEWDLQSITIIDVFDNLENLSTRSIFLGKIFVGIKSVSVSPLNCKNKKIFQKLVFNLIKFTGLAKKTGTRLWLQFINKL